MSNRFDITRDQIHPVVDQQSLTFGSALFGWQPNLWAVPSGVPPVVNGSGNLVLTNASLVYRATLQSGRVAVFVRVAADPTAPGNSLSLGLRSPSSASGPAVALLWSGLGSASFAARGDPLGGAYPAASAPVAWDAAWTNQFILFEVRWFPTACAAYINGQLVAELQNRPDDDPIIPTLPMAPTLQAAGASTIELVHMDLRQCSGLTTLYLGGGAPPVPGAGPIVYGSPDHGATAQVVPVQDENGSSPTEVLQVGGSTGPVGLGLTKALNLRTDLGSYMALNATLAESELLLNDTQAGWTGSADVTNIVFTGAGVQFDKSGATQAFAMISATNGNQNLDHFYWGGFRLGLTVDLTNVVNVLVRFGTDAANYGQWSFDNGQLQQLTANGSCVLRGSWRQPTSLVGTWRGVLQGVPYVAVIVTLNAVGDTFSNATLGPVVAYGGVPIEDIAPFDRSLALAAVGTATLTSTAYTAILPPVWVSDWREAVFSFVYVPGDETSVELLAVFSPTDTGVQHAEQLETVTAGSGVVTYKTKEHQFLAADVAAAPLNGRSIVVPIREPFLALYAKRTGGAGLADPDLRGQLVLHNKGQDIVTRA